MSQSMRNPPYYIVTMGMVRQKFLKEIFLGWEIPVWGDLQMADAPGILFTSHKKYRNFLSLPAGRPAKIKFSIAQSGGGKNIQHTSLYNVSHDV